MDLEFPANAHLAVDVNKYDPLRWERTIHSLPHYIDFDDKKKERMIAWRDLFSTAERRAALSPVSKIKSKSKSKSKSHLKRKYEEEVDSQPHPHPHLQLQPQQTGVGTIVALIQASHLAKARLRRLEELEGLVSYLDYCCAALLARQVRSDLSWSGGSEKEKIFQEEQEEQEREEEEEEKGHQIRLFPLLLD